MKRYQVFVPALGYIPNEDNVDAKWTSLSERAAIFASLDEVLTAVAALGKPFVHIEVRVVDVEVTERITTQAGLARLT